MYLMFILINVYKFKCIYKRRNTPFRTWKFLKNFFFLCYGCFLLILSHITTLTLGTFIKFTLKILTEN